MSNTNPLKLPTVGNSIQALTTPTPAATAAAKPAVKATGLGAGLAAGLPQLNDSVADKVKALTSQDSALMQQAKTEGLKVANRRGLLNSSMAIGASQDAMVSKALPIASQDASQDFQKNMQANDQNWQSGEKVLDRTQQSDLAKAQRDLDVLMQDKAISAADRQQIADIASREGIASAERALQDFLQGRDIKSREGMAAADRDLQTNLQGAEIRSREGMAEAERTLQSIMQGKDLASREGLAAYERELQAAMQGKDLASRETLAAADRALQQSMQQTEIGYQTSQRGLDRALQEQLASWNLKSADRGAAAQLLTNMQAAFQDSYSAIMANTNLDAPTREAQIVSAKNLRDKNLNLVEQMYSIDLKWTDADFGITTPAAAPAAAAPAAAAPAAAQPQPQAARALPAGLMAGYTQAAATRAAAPATASQSSALTAAQKLRALAQGNR